MIKNADPDLTLSYPIISRTEGVGPMQYGSKGLLGKNFADIEEKYDLSEAKEGFGEEGEEDANASDTGDDSYASDAGEDSYDGEDVDEEEEDADASDKGEEEKGSGFLDDSFEAY